VAARFNHACIPKANIAYEYDDGLLVMSVLADRIPQGEELTISYFQTAENPIKLYKNYGFRCRCGACDGVSDADVARLSGSW
jgi:hypothetical protein